MPRAFIFSFAITGILLNALTKPVALWFYGDSEITDGIIGLQPVILICSLLGLYCLFQAIQEKHLPNFSNLDLIIMAVCSMLCLLPYAKASWFALMILSLAGLIINKQMLPPAFKTGLILFFAISVRDMASVLFMDLFASSFLSLDATVVTSIYNLMQWDASAELNMIVRPDGHSLSVMTGCASFKDISMALLLWFSLSRLQSQKTLRYWISGSVLLILAIFMMNILRLSLMAASKESYIYFHEDFGVHLFSLFFFVIIAAFTLFGDRHAKA